MRRSWPMWGIAAVGMAIYAGWNLVTVAFCLPLQLLLWPFDPLRRTTAAIARWTLGIFLFRSQPFWRLALTGTERLVGGPWVIVANHQSILDIALLMMLPTPLRVVGRPGVASMPVFGQMARLGGHVWVDPERFEEGLAECRRRLDAGISMVVFPEGHRSADRTLLPFQRGAFELALRAGVPILPVVLRDTGLVLPPGELCGRVPVVRMQLQVLAPVLAVGARRGLAKRVFDQMGAALSGPSLHDLARRVKERYRPAGRPREGFAFGKVRFDPVYWMLWERLPRQGLVLDVGCGEGLLGSVLHAAGSGVDYRGYDIDADRVSAARAVGLDCARGSVVDVELPEADAIVCIDVLHYLDVPVQDAVIARLFAALRPGGMLVIRDPERAAGLRGWWTTTAERVFVTMGRHAGEGVRVRGSAALVAVLRQFSSEVRVEEGSPGTPFANALLTAKKAPAAAAG